MTPEELFSILLSGIASKMVIIPKITHKKTPSGISVVFTSEMRIDNGQDSNNGPTKHRMED